MILRLAEAPNAYEPLGSDEDLVITEQYVLFLGRGPDPALNCAQRLRLAPGSVATTVDEIRALVRKRGGRGLTWEVGTPATPPDLADRLLALGMVPAREPVAVAMALREAPSPAPAGVTVFRVETVDAFRTYVSITHEVFGMQDLLSEELERIDREGEHDLAMAGFVRYLARIDGEPVGAASATFTEWGVVLHAGCTKLEARGRGVYRALVAARWRDAVRRGTPVLVTRAGSMSRPILRRLGFQELAEIRILLDEF
ncbi:MAG: hypothetical protein ACRDON_06140 [Gaiellaceae bacterium]